jgi:purine-binding chemotaxis protein CheW
MNTSSSSTRELCTFFLDQKYFGVDLSFVEEILPAQKVTPVPLTPRTLAGIINRRGQIVPVLDLSVCLDLQKTSTLRSSFILILSFKKTLSAFFIDEIGDLVKKDSQDYQCPSPILEEKFNHFLSGVYPQQKDFLFFLNAEKLLSQTF